MSQTFYKNTEPKEEMLNTFYRTDMGFRSKERERFKDLISNRNNLKDQFQAKITAQNNIKDILKNHSVANYDINFMVQTYKDSCSELGEDNELCVQLFDLISNKKEEEIRNGLKKFTPKDKNNISKILEEIEQNNWNIETELINKLKELIK